MMAYVKIPPPSIEAMLDQFADWMAQHAGAKVTVRMDFHDGTNWTSESDHRRLRPKVGAGETANLCQQIRSAQIEAGENAVVANLRRMGLA
jgi:hypothetical protein